MQGPPLLLVEALAVRNDSGLGRLARLLVDALAGLAGEAEIHVILPRGCEWRPGPHCRVHEAGARPFRLWVQAAFPLLIRRLRPAAVLCLGQTLPLWRPASRYALLIPDIGPMEDLGHAASSHDAYNRRWLARMPARADRILTIGSFSRDRIQALLGIPGERIAVVKPIGPARWSRHRAGDSAHGSAVLAAALPVAPVMPGASVTLVVPGAPVAPVAPRATVVPPAPGHPPAGSYILAMGNVEPRKNFPGLIAAYARFASRHADAPPLYIVGHKAWGHAQAEVAARREGVADKVIFTGFVEESSREAWISGCAFFVSSSLYEGWGLPLFEALALGRPAIYHAGTSQEEFARGLALATDCSRAESLAEALGRLWTDAGERARLQAAIAEGFGKVLDYDLEGALRAALLPLLARP